MNGWIVEDCPICKGKHCISWDGDITYDDIGYDGNGTVTNLHCKNCGTEIEIRIPITDGDYEISDKGRSRRKNRSEAENRSSTHDANESDPD